MNHPKTEMKLTTSISEQNVFLTYVCTINDVKPTGDKFGTSKHRQFHTNDPETENDLQEEEHIKVERTKALHELVDAHADYHRSTLDKGPAGTSSSQYAATSSEENDSSENEDITFQTNDNPNVIKLTKMKWLTEDRDGSPDSRSPSISPESSSTGSQCSIESQTILGQHKSFADKYLSTILRLDKEHNLFGLSNIAIVGSRASKKICKKDDKAVFHQFAIVQVCCGKSCCKYRSNTDLPSLLKCGGCRRCCTDPCFASNFASSCDDPPICPGSFCASCSTGIPCNSKIVYAPPKCYLDCNTCYGVKISLKKKPKFEPTYVELIPRSSCVLAKPAAARSCHHLPPCLPPSSCFPYLMPCYWPARAGAPCTNPRRCFHNPPCPPARKRPCNIPISEKCPAKCAVHGKKCEMLNCPGNNPELIKEIQARFGHKQ